MAERSASRVWAMRALYTGLCLALIFLHLMPINTVRYSPLEDPGIFSGLMAAPDLIIAITFAWVLRRPEYVPPFLIAAIALLADLLFQRPPGLWAALILLASQTLRARALALRDLTFLVEWLSVTTTLLAMALGYRIILSLLVIDQPPLGLSLMQVVTTLLAYPAVALLSHVVFGVRKLSPGEIDATRGRI